MNETLVKYLAGLLDADGSLSLTFKAWDSWYYLGLSLSVTAADAVDKDGFVEKLPELTGMGSVYRYGKNAQFASWRVSKRADLEMLLPRLIKHMVIKAKHWQWLLDLWRSRRADSEVSAEERDDLTAQSKESRKTRVGPLRPKNHPTWAWLAGYLDGDGTYHYRSGTSTDDYRRWNIAVSAVAHANDASVLEFLQNSYGGVIRPHGQSDNVLVWWRSLGYQNREFALRFLPHLAKHSKLKREKIDAIIHHHRQRLSVPGTERRNCEVESCGRPVHGHGLCSMHYQRKLREV